MAVRVHPAFEQSRGNAESLSGRPPHHSLPFREPAACPFGHRASSSVSQMAGRLDHRAVRVSEILRHFQRRRRLGNARTGPDRSMVAVGAERRRLRSGSGRSSPAAVGLRDRCGQQRSVSGWRRKWWTQRRNPREDLLKLRARHHDLGHLEGDRAASPDDPGADLDQAVAKRCQRPMLDLVAQRRGSQEVRQIGCTQAQEVVGDHENKDQCSFAQVFGNGFISAGSVTLSACRPSRIASTISGASRVSRSTRET